MSNKTMMILGFFMIDCLFLMSFLTNETLSQHKSNNSSNNMSNLEKGREMSRRALANPKVICSSKSFRLVGLSQIITVNVLKTSKRNWNASSFSSFLKDFLSLGIREKRVKNPLCSQKTFFKFSLATKILLNTFKTCFPNEYSSFCFSNTKWKSCTNWEEASVDLSFITISYKTLKELSLNSLIKRVFFKMRSLLKLLNNLTFSLQPFNKIATQSPTTLNNKTLSFFSYFFSNSSTSFSNFSFFSFPFSLSSFFVKWLRGFCGAKWLSDWMELLRRCSSWGVDWMGRVVIGEGEETSSILKEEKEERKEEEKKGESNFKRMLSKPTSFKYFL